jgi:hypothetical protein
MRKRICWTALWVGIAISLTMQFFQDRRMSRIEQSIASIPERIIWRKGDGLSVPKVNPYKEVSVDGTIRFPELEEDQLRR